MTIYSVKTWNLVNLNIFDYFFKFFDVFWIKGCWNKKNVKLFILFVSNFIFVIFHLFILLTFSVLQSFFLTFKVFSFSFFLNFKSYSKLNLTFLLSGSSSDPFSLACFAAAPRVETMLLYFGMGKTTDFSSCFLTFETFRTVNL